jgi:hypothetical protein
MYCGKTWPSNRQVHNCPSAKGRIVAELELSLNTLGRRFPKGRSAADPTGPTNDDQGGAISWLDSSLNRLVMLQSWQFLLEEECDFLG